MMRPMLMMLAIAAFVSPNALAIDLPGPADEICVSEIVDDSGWSKTDEGAGRTFLIDGCVQITHDSEPGSVWAKSDVDHAVACSVHVREEAGVGFRVSWYRNGVGAEGYQFTDLTSDLYCSGDASIRTAHGGGIGPRAATMTLQEGTYYRDEQGVNEQSYKRSTQCQYFGAAGETSCTNVMETSVLHEEKGIKGVPSTFQVCYQVGWVDNVAPDLVTPLSGTGTNEACSDVVELAVDAGALLDLLR